MNAHTIHVGGHDMYYRTSGLATAPALMLVHGIGASHSYFLPLITHLEKQFYVIAVDLPGFGESSKPHTPLDIDGHAEILRQLQTQLQIDTLHIMGHSMGSQVVAAYAQHYSDAVGMAIMISPTVNAKNHSRASHFIRLIRDSIKEPAGLNGMLAKDYIKSGPRIYMKTLNHMVADHIEDRMPLITANVVYIRGADDPIVPHEWALSLRDMTPNSTYVAIAGARHGVHYSHPVHVAAAVVEAVRRNA